MTAAAVLRTVIEVWGGVNVGFTASMLVGVARLARRPIPSLAAAPPIVLLRPCEGDEPGLRDNLLSSLRVPYRGARRVIFLVPSADDPAWRVGAAVVAAAGSDPALSGTPVEVLVTAPRPLENRKVAQLAAGLAGSREEVVVCADSDVRLHGDDLEVLVATLVADGKGQRPVGAAFATPVEVAPQTPWDRLSAAVVGGSPQSFLALYGLSALLGGAPSMAGALCALRRPALVAVGGFEGLRDCLGEDNELARRLVAAGFRVELGRRPARCHDGGRTARQVIARVARWLTVVRAQRPGLLPTYPLLMAATPALLLVESLLRSPILAGFLATVMVLRVLLDRALRRFAGELPPGPLRALGQVLAGEGLLWLGFLRAASSRRIRWRGHPFHVERGGRLRPVRSR